MPVLRWTRPALHDLLAIIAWIADDNPDAAQALKDEIVLKTVRLAEHPRLYRKGRMGGTREMVVHRNYLVIYSEGKDTISILRVLHGAQQWP